MTLVRHGETTWAATGRHTGLTDVPLTEAGECSAHAVGTALGGAHFDRVFSSPLQRAQRTCELAGFASAATLDQDLVEWDYGEFEGLTTTRIHDQHPQWSVFRDGCPGGESVAQVAARVAGFLARACDAGGNILVFSSGHLLRMMTATWLGWPAACGENLILGTGSISVLAFDPRHQVPVLQSWNHQPT